MLIKRDLLDVLPKALALEAVLLWGPRQAGKTTLLEQLQPKSRLLLDDLMVRQQAQQDPALVLDNCALPCLIDEAQYAPNLFPEIKLRIDRKRNAKLTQPKQPANETRTLYLLTGSNRLLLDENVKESLSGRCHFLTLHPLSVAELLLAYPDMMMKSILFKGGLPELYVREGLRPYDYFNDYIISFVEKDIARSAGIEKLGEFHTVLRLLAARSGQFLNVSEIAMMAGIDQKTVQSWINILQRNFIVELVAPFASNLSKRITKMSKLYFYDVGVCSRLQGHLNEDALWHSAQAGSLFETLVFSEIAKTRANYLADWQMFTWRTKEKHEIDFVIQQQKGFVFIEAKLGIQSAQPLVLDQEAIRVFHKPHHKLVVTAGGERKNLGQETTVVPIQMLKHELLSLALPLG